VPSDQRCASYAEEDQGNAGHTRQARSPVQRLIAISRGRLARHTSRGRGPWLWPSVRAIFSLPRGMADMSAHCPFLGSGRRTIQLSHSSRMAATPAANGQSGRTCSQKRAKPAVIPIAAATFAASNVPQHATGHAAICLRLVPPKAGLCSLSASSGAIHGLFTRSDRSVHVILSAGSVSACPHKQFFCSNLQNLLGRP